ncbi:hypothetical protein AB1Y20_004544 [Prymnesium parvum]|uniref:RRM domain-containing protein n=1 Tax=Prymnesium parvum TaxID=97485 RepID=A0AB34IWR7_PRYPA
MVYEGGNDSDGKRCYVGNIGYDVKEDEIRSAFSEFGTIVNISYKQGFAFIDFQDKIGAEDAIDGMNGKKFFGRSLTVEKSGKAPRGDRQDPSDARRHSPAPRSEHNSDDYRPSRQPDSRGNLRNPNSSEDATRNLFVANIPEEMNEQDVTDHFSQYGRVAMVKFLPQKSETRAAFVDFEEIADAREAHNADNTLKGMRLRTDYNRRGQGGGGRRDDRGPPPRRPSPRYDDRRYSDRGPPPPRYDDRYDDRPSYRNTNRDFYDRGPPPPRYDDRRYDGRDDRYRERDHYYDRPPPMRGGYDDRRPYHDAGPPRRSRSPLRDDRRYDGPPPRRYDDAPPPRRYDDAPPPRRYDAPPARRYDHDAPPPRRHDDAPPRREVDDDRKG